MILVRNPDALWNRSCRCNEAAKARFEEVLRGVYPGPDKRQLSPDRTKIG